MLGFIFFSAVFIWWIFWSASRDKSIRNGTWVEPGDFGKNLSGDPYGQDKWDGQ